MKLTLRSYNVINSLLRAGISNPSAYAGKDVDPVELSKLFHAAYAEVLLLGNTEEPDANPTPSKQ